MPLSADLVRWDIVDQHLDEAAFLFEQWRDAFDSPRYRHEGFAIGLERRLLTHVDALAVGEAPVADQRLWPTLAEDCDDSSRATVATLALSISREQGALDRVIGHLLGLPEGAAADGMSAALAIA